MYKLLYFHTNKNPVTNSIEKYSLKNILKITYQGELKFSNHYNVIYEYLNNCMLQCFLTPPIENKKFMELEKMPTQI